MTDQAATALPHVWRGEPLMRLRALGRPPTVADLDELLGPPLDEDLARRADLAVVVAALAAADDLRGDGLCPG